MGKKRGLGLQRDYRDIKAAYNTYVAPVVNGYNTYMKHGLTSGVSDATRRLVLKPTAPPAGAPPGEWLEDEDPPNPGDDSRHQGFGHANRGTHVSRVLRCPNSKGIGYKAPGPVFNVGSSVVKQQFAIELTSGINHRNFTRMVFRSPHRFVHRPFANQPAVLFSKTLSPAPLSRIIDGVVVNTPVRDGNMSTLPSVTIIPASVGPPAVSLSGTKVPSALVTTNKEDLLFPLASLQDLEIASWNANPLKFLNWNSANPPFQHASTASPTGSANFLPLQVARDWSTDRSVVETATQLSTTNSLNYSSPFDVIPLEFQTLYGFTKRFENYLCHLGPGSVSFQMQNRLNTSCEIDIVVVQQRIDVSAGTNNLSDINNHLMKSYENQINDAYLAKFKSGQVLGSGYTGEEAAANDLLLNPTKPFLHEYRKFMNKRGYCKQVSRERFRIVGGASRSCRIVLPEIIYDAYEHRRWAQDVLNNNNGNPTAGNPYDYILPHSYGIYIAVQGVLMPAFPATVIAGVTTVGTTVVDTQVSPSSVLIHGTYIERPKPCLSVSPTKELQQKFEITDAVVDTSAGKTPYGVLLSGYVAEPPVSTSTSKVVT